MGYITTEQVLRLAEPIRKSGYGQYLIAICNEPYFSAEGM